MRLVFAPLVSLRLFFLVFFCAGGTREDFVAENRGYCSLFTEIGRCAVVGRQEGYAELVPVLCC